MPTIIKKSQVELRELSPTERARSASATHHGHHKSEVELVRDRGRVVALKLTCPCGQRSVIALDYEEQQTPTTPEEA